MDISEKKKFLPNFMLMFARGGKKIKVNSAERLTGERTL